MWQIDCALGAAKRAIPFQNELRSAKHRLRPPRLNPGHELVVEGAVSHVAALARSGVDLRGKEVLEIGSGWFPILPIVLRIAGARRVYLTDAYRLLSASTLAIAVDYVLERKEKIAAGLGLSPADVEGAGRPPAGLNFQAQLDWLGFDYLAPFETSRGMPEVDVVISHTVLEHIPPTVLETIFRDVAKALRPGGVMIHGVDNSDHRSHKDPRLGMMDFLRYSDSVWRWLCLHPQDYTNRLRHPDYIRLARACGFAVIYEDRYVSDSLVEHVAALPIDERFRGMDVTDLATSWTHFVAQPTSTGPAARAAAPAA